MAHSNFGVSATGPSFVFFLKLEGAGVGVGLGHSHFPLPGTRTCSS